MKEIKEYTFNDFIKEIDIDNIEANLLAFNFLEGIYKKQYIVRKKEVDNQNKKILYKYLVNQLKQIKSSSKEKTIYIFEKPIYSDEDKEFLKQTVDNGELSIFDLTHEEAIIVGFTGEEHRRAERKVLHKINLSKKEEKEFDKITENINQYNITPKLVYNIYNSVKTKK